MAAKLTALPESNDEYWEGAQVMRSQPIDLPICKEHDFLQNGNAALCTKCSFGALLPGYMRALNGKIMDLRNLAGE